MNCPRPFSAAGAFGAALCILTTATPLSSRGASVPVPLTHAHAHNDYEHTRPLWDALDHGFCSVEADIWLVHGNLLVGHTRSSLRPDRTLQNLYLDPLAKLARQNGGRIYPGWPSVTLLIDVKSGAASTYKVLRGILKSYGWMFTRFDNGRIETNAVTAIISGNRDRKLMAGEKVRYAAYDGRLKDLHSKAPASFIAWISQDWRSVFHWDGRGPFPPREKERLRRIVAEAHQHGRRVRFWDTPEQPALWGELLSDGVDLINTDRLAELRHFLLKWKQDHPGFHP